MAKKKEKIYERNPDTGVIRWIRKNKILRGK